MRIVKRIAGAVASVVGSLSRFATTAAAASKGTENLREALDDAELAGDELEEVSLLTKAESGLLTRAENMGLEARYERGAWTVWDGPLRLKTCTARACSRFLRNLRYRRKRSGRDS